MFRASFLALRPLGKTFCSSYRILHAAARTQSTVNAANAKTNIVEGAAPNIAKSRRLAPIAVTAKAADRVKELIDGKEGVVGVHLTVKRRGCNGYSYVMNYCTKEHVDSKKDEVVEAHGITVLVDPKAVFFIVGTTMDYNETELAAEFTFINPNIKGECGCGESFNV
jgi:iron-sulfur cluster assembly accessory protein